MYQPFPNFIKLFIPKKEPAPFNEKGIYELKFFSYELKRNFYFSETAYCLNITFPPPGIVSNIFDEIFVPFSIQAKRNCRCLWKYRYVPFSPVSFVTSSTVLK